MSITALLNEYKNELSHIEISPIGISNSDITIRPNQSKNEDDLELSIHQLNRQSIPQLNERYDSVGKEIHELKLYKHVADKVAQIRALIKKQKSITDLLDFQLLFLLLKATKVSAEKYSDLSHEVGLLNDKFTIQLNEYFQLLIPNEFVINNAFILREFNTLLENNGIHLEGYNRLVLQLEQLIEEVQRGRTLAYSVDEFDEVATLSSDGTIDTFQSYQSLASFINKISYFETDKLLNVISISVEEYIRKDISSIIRDALQITHLKRLSEVVPIEFIHQDLESDLKKIYDVSVVDSYINRIKREFQLTTLDELEDWEVKEIKNDEIKEDEDNWDDGWDDGWDDEKLDEQNESKQPQHINTEKNKISKLPKQLIPVFVEYRDRFENTSLLVTTFFALAIGKYPRILDSFLLYNDLNYLSQELDVDDFKLIALREFNQSVIEHYKLIKDVITKLLNNDKEAEDTEYYELDEESLNLMGSLYQLFNGIFQLRETNASKFRDLVINLVDCINYTLIKAIVRLDDISELQSVKFAHIIDYLNNVTAPFLEQISEKREAIKSFNKLDNIKFLISNHLTAIMDRFYEGEFRDVETAELCKVLQNVFEASELRDGYINEIVEFRT